MTLYTGRLRGDGLRVALVCARFNDLITERLLAGPATGSCATASTRRRSPRRGCPAPSSCPSWPSAGRLRRATTRSICLGAVIRGATGHYEQVADQCAAGIARARSTPACPWCSACSRPTRSSRPSSGPAPRPGNKGYEAAETAIEMADLLRQLPERPTADLGRRAEASSSPRARSSGPPSSCSRPPTWPCSRSSDVDYKATIDDPRVDDVRILRPQEIPTYVAEGLFDLGITGRDWIEETAQRRRVASASCTTRRPPPARSASCWPSPTTAVGAVGDLPDGVRVSTEYPELTRRFLAEHGVDAEVRLSYGATEAKIPDIADAWSTSPRRAGPCGPPGSDDRHVLASLHRAGGQPGRLRRPGEAPRHGAS